jgi:hypothetical protein
MARLDRNTDAGVLMMIQLQEEIISHQGAGTVRMPPAAVHRLRDGVPQEYLTRFDHLIETGHTGAAPMSASMAYDACERFLPAADVWVLGQMSELPAHYPQCNGHLCHDFSRAKSRAMTGRTAKNSARCKMRR